MGVHVAEYLGQRTDIDEPVIVPAVGERICPFMQGVKCSKRGHPICSVRKNDGTLWICCEHRLCATKKKYPGTNRKLLLCEHQRNVLLDIARHIFDSSVSANQIFIKREQNLHVIPGLDYHADYIMSFADGKSPYPGPDRLILEMQGGGETTETEKLTAIVTAWANAETHINEQLRQESRASTLETNAWRRQQEQFIVKGNIAMQTWKGYGIAFCMGTLLYDYLNSKICFDTLPDLHTHNWTLALIGIKEDDRNPIVPGPIPLMVDESRLLFTNYQTFVHALINQGLPTPEAFTGEFLDLNNNSCTIP